MDLEKIYTKLTVREEWHRRRLEMLTGKHLRLQFTYNRTLTVPPRKMYDFVGKAGIQRYLVLLAQTFDNYVVV